MIYACEGFDAVGKDTFIKQCLTGLRPSYRPEYLVFDKYLMRDDAWLIGLSIVDLLSKSKLIDESDVLLNRWLPSSYVYARLNAQDASDDTLDSQVVDKFLSILNDYTSIDPEIFSKFQIFHVRHKDASTAYNVYMSSISRIDNEELDNFSSFEDYWIRYKQAEELYDLFYSELAVRGATITRVISDNIDGKPVFLSNFNLMKKDR